MRTYRDFQPEVRVALARELLEEDVLPASFLSLCPNDEHISNPVQIKVNFYYKMRVDLCRTTPAESFCEERSVCAL